MAMKDVYDTIKHAFRETVERRNIHDRTVSVSVPGYKDGDYPVLNGAEVKMIAEFEGVTGECSTSYPSSFTGTLAQVVEMDMENDPIQRSVYFAALNGVMNKYEMADECQSCVDSDKENCGERIAQQYVRNNGKVNCLLVGYQPYMMKALAEYFPLRVLDLDPDNIGKTHYGVTIEDGTTAYAEATRWAEVILCTGSTLTNGTIHDYIKLPKDVTFYGTTIAGVARILEIRRVCPFGRN